MERLIPSPAYLVREEATDGSASAPSYSASNIDITSPGCNIAYRDRVWLSWSQILIQEVGNSFTSNQDGN